MKNIYKRNEHLIAANMGEEVVMMDVVSGRYYSLGVTGGAIWNILSVPSDLDTIVQKLLCEFTIDEETCEIQVQEFLNDAVEKNIFMRI